MLRCLKLYFQSNLFHQVDHVTLMCEHDDHTSCGFLHHVHNPRQLSSVVAPGQNLHVGQTTSTRRTQVRLEGSGSVDPVVIATDEQTCPRPAEAFEKLNHSTHLHTGKELVHRVEESLIRNPAQQVPCLNTVCTCCNLTPYNHQLEKILLPVVHKIYLITV